MNSCSNTFVGTTGPTKVVGTIIKEIFVPAIIAGTVVPTMIVVAAVSTRVVGTVAKEPFVPAIIVGTAVPTSTVLTAYY